MKSTLSDTDMISFINLTGKVEAYCSKLAEVVNTTDILIPYKKHFIGKGR